jgi:hypothetical protein
MRAAISAEIELSSIQLARAWSQGSMPGIPEQQLKRVVSMSISLALATLPQILDMTGDRTQPMQDLGDELEQQLNLLLSGVIALEMK